MQELTDSVKYLLLPLKAALVLTGIASGFSADKLLYTAYVW